MGLVASPPVFVTDYSNRLAVRVLAPLVNPAVPVPTVNRWWVYQRERFPIAGHGPLIAMFSFSAVSFSCLLRRAHELPSPAAVTTAAITSFILFLQLRIADEFKDFQEDSRFRPYRPVPRGLVKLHELGVIGVTGAAIQLVLAIWLSPSLIALLIVTWGYLALMTKEFFIRNWIRERPITYLWSHMLIIPLADFYATACDWRGAGVAAPAGLVWFIAVSFFNGVALEIGRKIRAEPDEEPGVRTYSWLWGRRNATLAWLGALSATGLCACKASFRIGFEGPVKLFVAVLVSTACLLAFGFLATPIGCRARRLEHFSGLWTLTLYLVLGPVPLVCQIAGGKL